MVTFGVATLLIKVNTLIVNMLKKAELNILPQGFSFFLFQGVYYVINLCINQLAQYKKKAPTLQTLDIFVVLYGYFNFS